MPYEFTLIKGDTWAVTLGDVLVGLAHTLGRAYALAAHDYHRNR